ncbi:MAG TPA: Maf family protein [Parvularculaceae bacterium]|nr:Maf family protein [Parvularculaceae bacterium]
MTTPRLVLASASLIRATILRDAGLEFDVARPVVDEDAQKARLLAAGADLEAIAMALAEAKALSVVRQGALVLGSDQILEHCGRLLDKPRSREEAALRLGELQGEAHTLINAVAVAEDGRVVFRHLDRPQLLMRPMSKDEIERYLVAAGDKALSSVGAYQVENVGARLFERIEGDHFAVLGLSLLPLLGFLRTRGIGSF